MKWFLIFLAIGLVATEKLDRTYLPPPGAKFSGGNLGDNDVPLEPPDHSLSGIVTPGHEGSETNFGLSGEPVNFGEKIAKQTVNYYPEKVPTTTISYAYSQTTTFPPTDNYESTGLPINPVTGLPINLDQANYPYGFPTGPQDAQNLSTYTHNQGQNAPFYGTNIQPDFGTTTTIGSPSYEQFENQPQSQYPGQNLITPGGPIQSPGSVYQINDQNQGLIRYPGGQGNTEQQKGFENYPGQNLFSPGGAVQIPSGNQNLIQYPDEQLRGQQGFVPSTGSPINVQPVDNQYGVNYDNSQGQILQQTYPGQFRPEQNEASYQNKVSQSLDGLPESGSTSSTIPELYYKDVSGTTPLPGITTSTSAYSSVSPVYRPERPQAAADRNADILNYENVRTPNSYSYSFDTSNGIHADESGIVDNGTKAQGAYSYIGDDGKLYSVTYTADENGFQPRGDHLPTPPPIPEAIKRVIEQAARDKEAGIIDDGSYNEAKYGDNKYQGPANRRHPQKLNSNQNFNKTFNGAKDVDIKPITGINEGNRRLSGDVAPSANLGGNDTLIINELDHYKTKKPESSNDRLMFSKDNLPYAKNSNQNQLILKNRRPSGHQPVSGAAKDMKTQYPRSQTDNDGKNFPGPGQDGYYVGQRQDTDTGSPRESDGSGENINTKYSGTIGAPINSNQSLKQRLKGNRRPSLKTQNRNDRPEVNVFNKETTNTPSISDYIKHASKQPASNKQATHQDDSGYYYQPPNTKFQHTDFPTRFRTQEKSSSSKPDQRRTEFNRGTTRKPFITPNVYNQNEGNQPSTTRRPFMTTGVTSPMDSSYTDYDDGDDYDTHQDIDNERINSFKNPKINGDSTYGPYEGTSTTLRPQYTLDVQRTRVMQKGSAKPEDTLENSGTLTPGYGFGSTTPMPSQSSRFGSTENPPTMKFQQGIPTTIPDSSTAVSGPESPSRTEAYKYEPTGPISEYYGTSIGPGAPATGVIPGFGLVSSTPGVSAPQSYSSSTYGPSQGYFSTKTVPATSGYNTLYSSRIPSSLPEVYQTPGNDDTGYHYGPPKSDYSLNILPSAGRPDLEFFKPSGPQGISSIYQTHQQGPDDYRSTTSLPTTVGRSDPFIQSQQGNIAPASSPIGTYTGNFQNGPSTPNYSTKVASTSGGKPDFEYPGSSRSPNAQETNRYEYGPSSSSYSTSITPGSFPTEGYSTTYRPGFQSTKDTFITGPVDGFGRPITEEKGGSHPGFYQSTKGPIDIEGAKFVGSEQSTAYPEPYDQSKVIGEDFSGPKQPQRYDPKTGYHYK